MPARRIIYALADSPRFTGWVSRHGMKWGFARRFIAGERLDEALGAVRELNSKDLYTTLDYLGESVTDEAATRAAAQIYCDMLATIAETQAGASVSMKLSQLGQAISDDLVSENLRVILSNAVELDNFVRIDIEDSSTTERTMNTMKAVRSEFTNVGVAVQSYLRRSEDDIRELNKIDAQVRLCKGAYKEPADVAFQKKAEVDGSYMKLAKMLLDDGNYPAFATHDPKMIGGIIEYAESNNIGPERYEFQMLYGIRRDEQINLIKNGYGMRVYVPYGEQWCPYFMRRIAERPANAMFVMRAMVKG